METIDFGCIDCGAKSGHPCVRMPPTGQVFEFSYYPKGGGRWIRQQVIWTRGMPFVEDIKRLANSNLQSKMMWPESDLPTVESLPEKWRKVGHPITIMHAGRIRTRYIADRKAEKEAMQQYLGEWLRQHGDIFQNPILVNPVEPAGLCPSRKDHRAHPYKSETLGTFWCTADQTQREPYRSERRRAVA